jgi:putative drug exporter of the RND superfamily
VIVAILSLYLVGIPFVSTLGLASAVTVAATLVAAVTLLPAMLAVFGGRLDRWAVRRLRRRAPEAGARAAGWYRWSRHVQRRPWPYLVASVLLLAVAALPLLSLRLGSAGDRAAPADSTQAKAYQLVADSFGPGWTGPLVVTVRSDSAQRTALEAGRLRTDLAGTAGVQVATKPQLNAAGDTAVITVVPTTAPDSRATEDLVHRLRGTVVPQHEGSGESAVEVHVGGPTATAIDLADRLGERLPWFMTFVVGLSMLLLMIEFRSVFVPVKAAAMNLLSVGAAYGAVVAVYQWGWLSDLTGASPGPIESFAPMMLFAVLFGLSMDYEVFLLSRVREDYLRTGDARDAVATGIASTARVITAAATVMVVVFASFVLNEQRVVNLFGFGLAVAIAVDATLVRLVLVPAVMSVAGRLAWFMPRWLARALPHVPVKTDHRPPAPEDAATHRPVEAGGSRAR